MLKNLSPLSLLNRCTGYLLLALLLVGCSSAPPTAAPAPTPAQAGGSCTLPESADNASADSAPSSNDESALRALLAAEGEYVVSQNIDALMRLWAETSRIADAKNTPDNADDDQVWDGKDAIRNRYVRIVFPGAPALVAHGDETITINGDQAQVKSTTTIGNEVAPAGDLWEMVRQGGCWYLASLTYNLEPAP